MISDLETILSKIRKAIIDGEYESLANLITDLEHAEAEIIGSDLDLLRAVKVEADRTGTCLRSALSGVRAARRRVADVAEAARGLTTYGPCGVKATVLASPPKSRRV